MNVHITARQTELTPGIKAYCEKRLQKIRRLVAADADVDVILAAEKNRFKAEVHVRTRGTGFLVAGETNDPTESLNEAFDAAERKLRKEREKGRDRKRRAGRETPAEGPAPEPAEGGRRLVRTASVIAAKPMTLEEAVLRFEDDGREVLVFRSGPRERWSILYRRRDGNFGLVEPE